MTKQQEIKTVFVFTWNVGYSITFLMNREVAEVTEEDDVRVRTLAVHADAADGVVVDRRTVVFPVRLDVEVRLLFQPEIGQFHISINILTRYSFLDTFDLNTGVGVCGG